jgi:hypothetical protein
MQSGPTRETLSSVLATHTAIRVARDVGYPHIDVPRPLEPAFSPSPFDFDQSELRSEERWRHDFKVLAQLAYYCLVGFAVLLGITVIVMAINGLLIMPGQAH